MSSTGEIAILFALKPIIEMNMSVFANPLIPFAVYAKATAAAAI